jgi:hypothetical protein
MEVKKVPNYLAAAIELENSGKAEEFKKRLDIIPQDKNWQSDVDILLEEFDIEVIPAGKDIYSGLVPSPSWIFKGIPSSQINIEDEK